MIQFDDELIKPTERFLNAIQELMRAKMEMMQLAHPETADCWTWGICEIGDLCRPSAFSFSYGGNDDKSDDFPEGKDCLILFHDQVD